MKKWKWKLAPCTIGGAFIEWFKGPGWLTESLTERTFDVKVWSQSMIADTLNGEKDDLLKKTSGRTFNGPWIVESPARQSSWERKRCIYWYLLALKTLNSQFYWQQQDNGNGSRAENIPSGDATLHCDFCHCNWFWSSKYLNFYIILAFLL